MFKTFLVKRLGGSANKQIPTSFPAFEASVCKLPPSKQYQGTFSPFPEPDFPQSLYGTRSPTNRGHIRGATVEPGFTNIPMTPPFTLEINRTVAALAAETGSSPIVADKSCVERKAQPALRPQLPYASPTCFRGMKRVDEARKHGGVLALGRVTRTTGRRMVWLKVWNGRAHVMVDKAQHNNWKRKHFTNDVERRQHEL